MKNLKKLTRKEQKTIKGGIIQTCRDHSQCDFGECCEGKMCVPSPYPLCGPILE
ncbi:bacteriocin-like protein [Chryseobacterium oranimense]|uniref:Bacteriocin-type signal sequence-containing protein n=1 Tax=Chryseobacterium oranimense TaxID=421058 RepID=A0A1M5UCE4_9FLAO|nr:hypothetical protein [Chryseobacterium oranimense]SHH60702.1 hypothetical protein SAMN05421866_3164 [Chryseobacterium oranimense]